MSLIPGDPHALGSALGPVSFPINAPCAPEVAGAHGLPVPSQLSLHRAKKLKIHFRTAKVCSLRSSGTNKGANSTMLIPLLAQETFLNSAVVWDTCQFLLLTEVAKHLWELVVGVHPAIGSHCTNLATSSILGKIFKITWLGVNLLQSKRSSVDFSGNTSSARLPLLKSCPLLGKWRSK